MATHRRNRARPTSNPAIRHPFVRFNTTRMALAEGLIVDHQPLRGVHRSKKRAPHDRNGSIATDRHAGAARAMSALPGGFNRSTQHLLILLDWEVSDGGE